MARGLKLVNEFLSGIQIELNNTSPALSTVYFKEEIRLKVEVLKNYTFQSVIMSPRLKIVEYRGYDIVQEIFKAITKNNDTLNLMPEDFRSLCLDFKDKALKMRVVCDFIAGMTDRYAVEYYSRLISENPQTIFKPF